MLENQQKYRILFIAAHPVQYAAPLFRKMAQHPNLDILVAYCSLQGAISALDTEFNQKILWDIPLLDGYSWVEVAPSTQRTGLGGSVKKMGEELWKLTHTKDLDAIVIYTGYHQFSFWLSLVAAKTKKIPILFGTDAHEFSARDKKSWKQTLKRRLLPIIFGLADAVIVPSTGGVRFVQGMGIPLQRIHLTPYVVDNEWWISQAAQVNRSLVRQQWNIPEEAWVVLYCAKLQPWKRPEDLLHAFAKAAIDNAYLVLAGDGPLRTQLEIAAKNLKVLDKVRFLGFVNQSQLPSVYGSSDVFVLPSDYEPFGVVVNEAMLCGCPVIVSDRVGAGYDLIQQGETGYIYPTRNVQALAQVLTDLFITPDQLKRVKENAQRRILTWSYQENISALITALSQVCKNSNASTRRSNETAIHQSSRPHEKK